MIKHDDETKMKMSVLKYDFVQCIFGWMLFMCLPTELDSWRELPVGKIVLLHDILKCCLETLLLSLHLESRISVLDWPCKKLQTSLFKQGIVQIELGGLVH